MRLHKTNIKEDMFAGQVKHLVRKSNNRQIYAIDEPNGKVKVINTKSRNDVVLKHENREMAVVTGIAILQEHSLRQKQDQIDKLTKQINEYEGLYGELPNDDDDLDFLGRHGKDLYE